MRSKERQSVDTFIDDPSEKEQQEYAGYNPKDPLSSAGFTIPESGEFASFPGGARQVAAKGQPDSIPFPGIESVGFGAMAPEVAPPVVSAKKNHVEGRTGNAESCNESSGDRVKITTKSIRELKGQRPIVALTAYDFPTTVFADEAGVDLILVGDSVGTTVLGFPDTVPVTLEMMQHHAATVLRALPEALVVVDLPFAEASLEKEHVLRVSREFLRMGAGAVKIEGGKELLDLRKFLVGAGVPVLGHIGLLPQRVHVEGGYRRFGLRPEEADQLREDAASVEESGCFACIGEMIDPSVTAGIRDQIGIPLIGIGCGSACDGQILVSHDLLGLGTEKPPGFVKVYAELGQQVRRAFEAYRDDVVEGRFPQ